MNEKELTFDFETGEIIEKKEEIKAKPVIEKPSMVTETDPVEDEENEDVEESEDGVEEETEDKPEVNNQTKKPTIPANKTKTYKGIKVFRYGATDIYNEIGIDENTEYTEKDLINRLNANGYYEFIEGKTNFAYNEERGILAVTIQGNSKG